MLRVGVLTSNLNDNINIISDSVPANFNFIKRELIIKDEIRCFILYIIGLAKQEYIENSIVNPLLFKIQTPINNIPNKPEYISKRFVVSSDIQISGDVAVISDELKNGKCIILIESESTAIICNTTGGAHRNIAESNIEKVIKGGREAFIEDLQINISLVQQGLKNDHLKIEKFEVGEENHADAVLIYLDNAIDPEILSNIKNSISSENAKQVLGPGMLNQIIEKFPYSIFPQSKTSEKPTKVISDILQGKAAILVAGSPYAMIVPAVFIEFFQDVEDYANRILNANFDRMLRLLASIIVLTLSSIYLVLLTYNSGLTPLNMIKIIINSRLNIPIPPFLEILIMEMLVEVLREGGLRLPTPIGSTLSIVGGIVLGQAATLAGIVSPTTLVVIAITVICTFVIPNYEMALSIRLLRFFILILTNFFGFLGLLVGIQLIIVTLIRMDSFGIPYFTPLAPLRFKGLKDSFIRVKIKKINTRAEGFQISKRKKN